MLLILLAFVASLVASYLLNTSAITIITHRISRVIPVSVLTNLASLASLYIIGKASDWDVHVIVAVGVGDVVADFLVCKKFPRPIYNWLTGRKPRGKSKKWKDEGVWDKIWDKVDIKG